MLARTATTDDATFDPESVTVEAAYPALGLPQGARRSEIRSAYRRLVLKVHPDRRGASDDGAAFRRLKAAYDCLVKHTQFDEELDELDEQIEAEERELVELETKRFERELRENALADRKTQRARRQAEEATDAKDEARRLRRRADDDTRWLQRASDDYVRYWQRWGIHTSYDAEHKHRINLVRDDAQSRGPPAAVMLRWPNGATELCVRHPGLVAVPQSAPSPPSHESTADQRVLKPGATACRAWAKQGSCDYAAACHFRHDTAPKPDAALPLPKLKEGNVDYALLSFDAVVNHPHFLASSECHRHLSTDREGRLFFRLTKIDHQEDDPFERRPHGLTEWTTMCCCPYQQPASCTFPGGVELQRLVAVHCDVPSVLMLSTTCRGLHFLSHELAQQEEVLMGIALPAWQHKMPLSYRRRARCRSTLFGSPQEASRHGGILGSVDAKVQGASCTVRKSCLTKPGHEAVAVLQVAGDIPAGDRVGSYGYGGDGELTDYFCCSPTQTAALQMAWQQRVAAQADSPPRCPLSCEDWDGGVHAMQWIAGKRYKCNECKTTGPPGHRWRCGACYTAQEADQGQFELCSPCGDDHVRRDQIEVGKLLAVATEAVAAGEGMFVFISGGNAD